MKWDRTEKISLKCHLICPCSATSLEQNWCFPGSQDLCSRKTGREHCVSEQLIKLDCHYNSLIYHQEMGNILTIACVHIILQISLALSSSPSSKSAFPNYCLKYLTNISLLNWPCPKLNLPSLSVCLCSPWMKHDLGLFLHFKMGRMLLEYVETTSTINSNNYYYNFS